MQPTDDTQANDQLFCWEQVNKVHPVFRVSQVFVSRDIAARLLPLYAFFSIIEQLGDHSSDEDVVGSKFAWWRMECSAEGLKESRHPVLRELRRTIPGGHVDPIPIRSLLDAAEARTDGAPVADISELMGRCGHWAGLQFAMEAMVCGVSPNSIKVSPSLLARNGLLQLFRESISRQQQGSFYWIPMDLLARQGINKAAFVDETGSSGVQAIMQTLLDAKELWAPAEIRGRDGLVELDGLRNFAAISGCYSKKLKKIIKCFPGKNPTELSRIGISDLFTAWSAARLPRGK